MIDSHIHLDADQFADSDAVVKQAREFGVTAVVVPGVSPASNRRALELCREYPDFVHCGLGFHPERPELTDDDLQTTLRLLESERDSICAVGEVGLPYYGDAARIPSAMDKAQETLARFARAAVELDLAMILHCPHETAGRALEIIRPIGVRRAVFHWHKADEATTRAIIEAGYFVSLTPEVVYRERDQALARSVPLANMMVETDGPWPYRGPFEGRRTEPAMVLDAIAAIARIKGETDRAVADATTANARMLFQI